MGNEALFTYIHVINIMAKIGVHGDSTELNITTHLASYYTGYELQDNIYLHLIITAVNIAYLICIQETNREISPKFINNRHYK